MHPPGKREVFMFERSFGEGRWCFDERSCEQGRDVERGSKYVPLAFWDAAREDSATGGCYVSNPCTRICRGEPTPRQLLELLSAALSEGLSHNR
jgi:hypothetical protein